MEGDGRDCCALRLSAVVSDIFGASGRAMLAAMIGGQRDPRALAQLAIGRMRAKLTVLEDALTGHFSDHHAFICQMMLDRIDDLTRRAAGLTARIEEQITPLADAAARLDEIPGIGPTAAH